MATHIDTYHFAEILQSRRFANAVMFKILGAMPQQRFDAELKDVLRSLHDRHVASSPLRTLYFESVIFWRMNFHDDDPNYCARHSLHLDSKLDAPLIDQLVREWWKYCIEATSCECATMASTVKTKDNLPTEDAKHPPKVVLGNKLAAPCSCTFAPWLKDPARFFTGS